MHRNTVARAANEVSQPRPGDATSHVHGVRARHIDPLRGGAAACTRTSTALHVAQMAESLPCWGMRERVCICAGTAANTPLYLHDRHKSKDAAHLKAGIVGEQHHAHAQDRLQRIRGAGVIMRVCVSTHGGVSITSLPARAYTAATRTRTHTHAEPATRLHAQAQCGVVRHRLGRGKATGHTQGWRLRTIAEPEARAGGWGKNPGMPRLGSNFYIQSSTSSHCDCLR